MPRAVSAPAPTRLDFGGGWTDVPPYPEREGGVVCSVAISRYATATVASHGHVGERTGESNQADDALVQAALRRCHLAGIDAQISSDYPVGAGLGGSSAAGVAVAGALAALGGTPLEPHALAALSRDTEITELGVPGGYQDHYTAAFGGALLMRFGSGVDVERIPLSETIRASLSRRGVLVYTGESRISGDTIVAVRDAYVAREARVVNALASMKSLALQMAAALRAGDLDTLGTLVGAHWAHQRELHPSISTPRIDAIMAAASRAGALGAKALGASGGGCVLAIAEDGRDDELARALAPLGELLTYAIDVTGFAVIASLEGSEPPPDVT
jgi:D-glycero-alpha-D-manno-heptose-7-phosphate kinase